MGQRIYLLSGCLPLDGSLQFTTLANSMYWGQFHEKSQFETSFGLSLGLKSETFVSAEFLAQIDFTKGDSAETGLKS